MRTIVTCFFLFLLVGCGLLPEIKDDTKGWTAAKLYAEAKNEMDTKNYVQAIKLFEKLEARYPYGQYAQQAQLETAYAYFKDNEAASAIAAADRFIKLHPAHPNVDYAYYLKGLINFNENEGLLAGLSRQDMTERDPKAALDSFEAFKELTTRFPNSKYAADSLARMKYLINALAAHEVHVGHYYLKRGAYVAAVNRAQYTLRTYPQAPAIEGALILMIEAYDALGEKQLRDDAKRVLEKNFPKSVYLTGIKEEKSWWKVWE